MTIPLITPSPAAPSRTGDSPAVFATKADTFTAWWEDVGPEINATAGAMNDTAEDMNSLAAQVAEDALAAQVASEVYDAIVAATGSELTGGSGTSVTIGLGSKSWTAATGKLWFEHMSIILRSAASAANYMVGEVDSYDPSTGALTVTIYVIGGSGSHNDWLIYPAGHRYDPKWTTVQTLATTSGSSVTFGNIPQTFEDLRLLLIGVSHNHGSDTSLLMSISDDGTNFAGPSGCNVTDSASASATFYGGILIPGYRATEGVVVPGARNLTTTRQMAHNSSALLSLSWRLPGPITHVRVQPNSGAYDAGSIVLQARG